MSKLIVKILDEINKHLLVYFNLLLAAVFGLFFHYGVVGLVFFSLAIGILIGEENKNG